MLQLKIAIGYIQASSERLATYRHRVMVFEKGAGASMTSALFCDECGAALPTQAMSCALCGYRSGTSLPPPLVKAVQAPLPPPLAASAGALRPGSLLAQRYGIISQIGQGGFATVYKAKDCDQKNKLVAIKQISLQGLSPKEMIEATDVYNRELMYLSKLKHENLPRIYDHFTDPEHWYVVMEYIEGKTLEDTLKTVRGGHLSAKKVLDTGITLCSVLGYLHAQYPPIIYRDVKPANILITREGRLSLIDFGIARHFRVGQAKDTGALGSPGYAAPEQYGKAQTTAQTDIYGLGATLQTLLTGKEPLEILVGGESLDCIKPKDLRALLAQMLEQDASRRPQNMDEVKQSLQRLKEHSAGQRVKRTLASIGHYLPHIDLQLILLVALLLFICLIFFFTGFFNSLFWIPCLLLMLCSLVGRSAHYLHKEMEVSTTRLNAKEAIGIVYEHLKGSILSAFIPAILFYFLYYILYDTQQQGSFTWDPQSNPASIVFLGSVVLVFIIYGLYFLKGEISWLFHLATSWRRTRKPVQIPPLRQHRHKRP
jgi:tRNA A-37 threonylcarbamoyl transferase component Bud32